MSWRTALRAVFGLLLPLPMVLLLASALPMGMPAQHQVNGHRVSPVLAAEERARLQTYHRDCALSSECEPPLGCLLDTRAGAQYCSDSQCLTDVQCRDGQVCRTLTTSGDGPLVRICVPVGVRKEGEMCVEIGRELVDACAPGLTCGGQDGFCARPCKKEDPASCPEGFFCAETELESLCLPTCEKTGCPDGQHCIQYEDGASACAKVYGTNCRQTPCADNQECLLDHDTSRPATVWMHCWQFCREDPSSCPPGLICNGWSCHPPCAPEGPNTCAEGYRCKKRRASHPWVCLPDW